MPIAVTVTRGEGAVELLDASVVEEVVRRGTSDTADRTWLGPDPCEDTITVPVQLSVTGEGVGLIGATTLANDPRRSDPDFLSIARALDPGVDQLPAGHGEPAGGDLWLSFHGGALFYYVRFFARSARNRT